MPLGAGAGVEADRRGGGEVEALGAAVDRDPDPVVGERGQLGGQPPRLVAEQPGGRAGEQPVVGASSRSTSPAPSAASTRQPGGRGRAHDRGRRRRAIASGRWKRLPTRGPHGLGVVGVDRAGRPAPPRRRRPRRRSGSRCRRCRGRGRRRRRASQPRAPRRRTSLERHVEEAADGDDALRVHGVAERGQRARRRRASRRGARRRAGRRTARPAAAVREHLDHAAGDGQRLLDGLRALGEEEPLLGPGRRDGRASVPS